MRFASAVSLMGCVGVASAQQQFSRGFVRQPRPHGLVSEVDTLAITAEMRAAAPDALDWSAKGATTPIKDQGKCASCWAFSVVETVESAVFVSSGHLPTLSQQQLISCEPEDGCGGGEPATALNYTTKVGGLTDETNYPDKSHCYGASFACSWNKKVTAVVDSWQYAVPPCWHGSCTEQDEDGLAAALAAHGPLSICVNARAWEHYSGGVVDWSCGGDASLIDHCVQLVGYDKKAEVPYWKVRNSWTGAWGEDGFIRLSMGKNQCGLANEAIVVKAHLSASATGPFPYVPQPTCPTRTTTTSTTPHQTGFEPHPGKECGDSGTIIAFSGDGLTRCAEKCSDNADCVCFDLKKPVAGEPCSSSVLDDCACRLHSAVALVDSKSNYTAFVHGSSPPGPTPTPTPTTTPVPSPPAPTPSPTPVPTPGPGPVPGFVRHAKAYCGPAGSFSALSDDGLADCAAKCEADSECECFDALMGGGACDEKKPSSCACRLHHSSSQIVSSSVGFDAYTKASASATSLVV